MTPPENEMKATQKRKPNIAVLLLASLAAVMLILSLFARFGSGSVIPGGFLRVASGSMAPELNEGDLIFVWKTPYEELKVGDTVTVNDGQGLVTHKIVKTSDGCIVTRGVANDLNDLPSGEGNYVAKTLFSLPGLGWTAEALGSPVVLFASIAIILFALLAPVALRAAYGEKTHGLAVRGAAAALACAMVILPIADTSARYKGELSGGGILVANEVNFTSNYLFDGGNEFGLNGWLGGNYKFEISVYNYSNALKFNLEDVKLQYELVLEKLTGPGYFTEYEVAITQSYIKDEEEDYHRDHINKDINPGETYVRRYPTELDIANGESDFFAIRGGRQLACNHIVEIYKVSNSIPDDAMIGFTITAKTAKYMTYEQELSATFKLTRSRSGEFIESESTVQSTASEIIRHTIRSGDVLGAAQRRVIFLWDTDDIYINSYQTDIWNIVQMGLGDVDTTDGLLDMTFQSNSSLTLEFFKHDRSLLISPYRETITVLEKTWNGNVPTTSSVTVERTFLYTNPLSQTGGRLDYTLRERAGSLATHDQSSPHPVMKEYEVLPRHISVIWPEGGTATDGGYLEMDLDAMSAPGLGTRSDLVPVNLYGTGNVLCGVLHLEYAQSHVDGDAYDIGGDVDLWLTFKKLENAANRDYVVERVLEPVLNANGSVNSYNEYIYVKRASLAGS